MEPRLSFSFLNSFASLRGQHVWPHPHLWDEYTERHGAQGPERTDGDLKAAPNLTLLLLNPPPRAALKDPKGCCPFFVIGPEIKHTIVLPLPVLVPMSE